MRSDSCIWSDNFADAINWLKTNKERIQALAGHTYFNVEFGNSNWAMPLEIYNKLTPSQIAWLQQFTVDWLDKDLMVLNTKI